MRLDILDYIVKAEGEVIEHTRAEAPTAGPAPAAYEDILDWCREHTEELDEERQQARETLIYRQGLEHAIAMGDVTVVRRHPCPACGCWGLFWLASATRAVCVNRYCTNKAGLAHRWPLATLAHRHITAQKRLKSSAT
ncbi:hypothetical protein [Streptomyces sp. NPDC059076]|uniref:hypothetical protein n=1 Tax=unclassified Streptomyces TaxID=2593676 RepID=UPI0036CD1993